MRDTSNDALIGVLLGTYLSREKEPGFFGYFFGTLFIFIPIIGIIFSIMEDEILNLFGDFWVKMIIPHIVILVGMTFIILMLEIRILNNRLKPSNDILSLPTNKIILFMLYSLSALLSYALLVGFDIQLFSQSIHAELEHSREVGDGLGSLILMPIHFISIPIEFTLKLLIVPIAQFVFVRIILFSYYIFK